MNKTTIRRMQLRDLAKRVAGARAAMAQQLTDRDSVIGRNGAAHPRSIRASRRLRRTQSAYRSLVATYRRHQGEDTPGR
jgi:inosine-uridine nucleoside N-ribohydrolase